MIDTHCHLDHPRFDPDRAEVLARARAAGVERIVVPGVYPSTWEALRDSAQAEPLLAFALGIHPQVLPALDAAQDDAHLEAPDAQLARGGAVAVGECGLDGGSVTAGAPMERQVAVLRAHLRLARKHRLPAMVHCLRAHPELRQLLEEEGLPEAGLVIHSYSGGPELVKIFAPLGCHFGLCGPVTYENARKPLAAAKLIPPERLLLETACQALEHGGLDAGALRGSDTGVFVGCQGQQYGPGAGAAESPQPIEGRQGFDQHARIGVFRRRKDFLHGADLHQFAAIHHAERGDEMRHQRHVVPDEDDGSAEFALHLA